MLDAAKAVIPKTDTSVYSAALAISSFLEGIPPLSLAVTY